MQEVFLHLTSECLQVYDMLMAHGVTFSQNQIKDAVQLEYGLTLQHPLSYIDREPEANDRPVPPLMLQALWQHRQKHVVFRGKHYHPVSACSRSMVSWVPVYNGWVESGFNFPFVWLDSQGRSRNMSLKLGMAAFCVLYNSMCKASPRCTSPFGQCM